MRDTAPDIILSGINRGANLGIETVFSGTVGAAMTGMLLRLPAIALSQAFSDPDSVRWDTARALAPKVIRHIAAMSWSDGACLNINFPDCPAEQAGPIALTRQGAGLLDGVEVIPGRDPRNVDYYWLRFHRTDRPDAVNSEAEAINACKVSVTPLHFERTHDDVLARMQRGLS